jgi:Raf kinase inhibitor-like YbhB/YbcL family protein
MSMRGVVISYVVLALSAVSLGAQDKPAPKAGFTLSSPAFPDGGEIPAKYTQADPKPVSPKLEWSNVPANAAAFVLLVIDPDAALRKSPEFFIHSMMLNIPGTARELPEGVPAAAQLPDGTIQTKNFRGEYAYLPPGAPAPGPHHHYMWKLFALDAKLTVGPDATYPDVMKAMEGHVLGAAVMVGRFHR